MSKVVFRIGKIHEWGKIGAAAQHNTRTRHPANADPHGPVIKIAGPENDVAQEVRRRIGAQKIRKNAVIAVEAIITASPEYFRGQDPGKAGGYDADKLAQWRAAVEPWIAAEFPDAASVELHLDEATPHYHIIDVPLDSQGKLNARAKYGGRDTMRAWQDRAAAAVAHLAIERGTQKSVATHTRIQEYYGHVVQPMPEVPKITVPRPPDDVTLQEKIPFTAAKKERDAWEAKYASQIAAHNTAILRNYRILEDKIRHIPLLEKENQEQAKTIAIISQEGRKKDMQIERLKEQANQLRALPLNEVLGKMYNANETTKTKEGNKSHEYELLDGQKIMITADKWIDNATGKGGKGAINLVMYLEQCEYKQAIKKMTEYFDPGVVSTEYARHETAMAVKRVQSISSMPAVVPAPNAQNWEKVRKWLIESRGLPQKLVDWLKEKGKVYADIRANAVFPRRDSGAFLRGTTEKKWHQTIGGKEGGPWIVLPLNAGQERVIGLAESPLDAAALAATKPEMEVWALGGNLIRPQDLKAQLENVQVWAAFDSDQAGGKMAEEAAKVFNAKRVAPAKYGKDWAEAVRNHPELIDDRWNDQQEGIPGPATFDTPHG